jgi:rubredoxin---NAD+ reductase
MADTASAIETSGVVIIGSGLAAYTLAREFRKLDKQTPLTILSRDHAGFYSKPMLSNALASNKTAATLVMKSAEKMATELNASVRANTQVDSIHTAEKTVRLRDGEEIAYRDLVLALGADTLRIQIAGDGGREGAEAVLSVNDLDDYARFADKLEGVKTVAILGGGLIGCEFANDLLHRGIHSTVIDLADRPLSRLLPVEASAFLRQKLEAAGVQFRFNVAVHQVNKTAAGFDVELTDNSHIQADLVLSAIGLRPRTELADATGIVVNRGVQVNRHLATSAEHVHALGDCAEVAGHVLPYVMPLMQQARALAATLTGTPTQVVYPCMPVMVKTPACPTVVCPPTPHAVGEWQVATTDDGCDARFIGADGSTLGFALLGAATAQKQTLAAQVAGWLT